MGFVMDGLSAEDYDRTYGDQVLIRRITAYFRPHMRRILIVATMVMLFSFAETVLPIVVARGIDALSAEPSLALLAGIALFTAFLGSLSWFFNYIRQLLSARVIGDVVLTLRDDAFDAVTRRDLSFYDQYPSGKIVSRVTSDTQDFSNVVTLTIDLISQLVLVVVLSVVLFVVEPTLALITISVAPAFVITALVFRRIARWTSRRTQRMRAQVNNIVQETISGIAVAKTFRQEAAIYNDFTQTNRLAYRVTLQNGLVFNTIFPILDILAGIGSALVIFFGGLGVVGNTISLGNWYLFFNSLGIFYFPLISIASFWSQFQQGLAASERVFALIDAEPRVIQTAHEPVPELRGEIRFEQLDFHYRAGEPILKQFSLDIPAGQKIAIVGHTGAGKSSLIRLIMRFYEFQAGRLLIDGRDMRQIDLSQYRRQLGLVPQSPFLFSGTVAENICYGRPDATLEQVEQAARSIGDGEWLDGLPRGLDTDVGERGGQLSLGQRQLVALARVILQNPAIFLLDEATASIDPFTESQIQTSLDMIMQGRTSIIIAHRLSTVRSVDRIIVMRQGRIIEEGTHQELLSQKGHYAELFETYFRHQSLEYIEQVGMYS
ncbi:MAG: ABC transporter ATP-binding protein [Chloroflexaceae bacterium]|nr:ABC transporter ATP-binding protein [Chloroflexaceae bacterium]